MALRWLSVLRYGSGPTDWTATIPVRPWDRSLELTGGTLEVASLLRESFTINVKRELGVTFRVKESELSAFLLAIEYGMQNPGGTFTFYPNGTAATGYDVYLISPAHGERWQPQRSEEMGSASTGSVFECLVVFRKVDGTAWALNYYAP
jgi:hypothetical protein